MRQPGARTAAISNPAMKFRSLQPISYSPVVRRSRVGFSLHKAPPRRYPATVPGRPRTPHAAPRSRPQHPVPAIRSPRQSTQAALVPGRSRETELRRPGLRPASRSRIPADSGARRANQRVRGHPPPTPCGPPSGSRRRASLRYPTSPASQREPGEVRQGPRRSRSFPSFASGRTLPRQAAGEPPGPASSGPRTQAPGAWPRRPARFPATPPTGHRHLPCCADAPSSAPGARGRASPRLPPSQPPYCPRHGHPPWGFPVHWKRPRSFLGGDRQRAIASELPSVAADGAQVYADFGSCSDCPPPRTEGLTEATRC